jgi:hypothetical protein
VITETRIDEKRDTIYRVLLWKMTPLANCLSASVTKHRSASSNKFRSPLGTALSVLKRAALRGRVVDAGDASLMKRFRVRVDSKFANPIGRNEEMIAH